MGSENIVRAPSPCASESALADLLARLEGLSGANFAVELEIYLAFGGDVMTLGRGTPPAYTASIDAAVALVERVLPGWVVDSLGEHLFADHRAKGPWKCSLRSNPHLKGYSYAQCHYAPTAPLALLRALVAAKIEEAGNE